MTLPNIACCYSQLHQATFTSVKKYAPCARFYYTGHEKKYNYRDTLKRLWTGERDLIVIEQDIEIDATFNSLAACPEDWCTYCYQSGPHIGYWYRGLGCTKFSAKLQREYPFEEFNQEGMMYAFMDSIISDAFTGMTAHVHGKLEHHHEYSAPEPPEICWNLLCQENGDWLPVASELQADGVTINLHEIDIQTLKRGRYIKTLPEGSKLQRAPRIFT